MYTYKAPTKTVKTLKQKASLLFFCVIILFLFDLNFFYLVKLPPWLLLINSKSSKILIVVMGIVMSVWYSFKSKKFNKEYRYYWIYLIITLISVIIVIISSQSTYYKQGLNSTWKIASSLLIVFLSIPILYLFENGYNIDDLFKYLNIIVMIWYIVVIFQYFTYRKNGHFFLIDYFSSDEFRIRNNSIRLTLFSLGNIAILYNFNEIYVKKKSISKKIWNLIILVAGLFCVFFVQQTRMFYIVDCVGVMIIILASSNKPHKVIWNLMLIGFVFLLLSDYISRLFNSFIAGDDVYNYNSSVVRQYANIYFFQSFLKNPWFALGFVSDGVYPYIAHGPALIYNMSDVGFIGLLAQTGLFALFIYVMPIIRCTVIIIKIIHRKLLNQNTLLFSLYVYMLVSSISLMMTTPSYAILLPVIYAYFEFENRKLLDVKMFEETACIVKNSP